MASNGSCYATRMLMNTECLISFANIFSCFYSHIVIKLKELSRDLLNYLSCVQNNLLIEENMKIVVYRGRKTPNR